MVLPALGACGDSEVSYFVAGYLGSAGCGAIVIAQLGFWAVLRCALVGFIVLLPIAGWLISSWEGFVVPCLL